MVSDVPDLGIFLLESIIWALLIIWIIISETSPSKIEHINREMLIIKNYVNDIHICFSLKTIILICKNA